MHHLTQVPERDRVASSVAAQWAEVHARGDDFTPNAGHGELVAPTALVMGDLSSELAAALSRLGWKVVRWHRHLTSDQKGGPTPPRESFQLVAVRLPRSRRESEMLLRMGGARVIPGGRLVLYGATDEGIKSADRHFPPGFSAPTVQTIKRRCRLLVATTLGPTSTSPEGELEAWQETALLDFNTFGLASGPHPDETQRPWVFFPGMFAEGRFDDASALLCRVIRRMKPPRQEDGAADLLRVLDFGAGSGVLAAAVLDRFSSAEVYLADIDAISLQAAAMNVPGARPVQISDPRDAPGPFNLIVSNPPFHSGKTQNLKTMFRFLEACPDILTPRGTLLLVTQKRLLTEDNLRRHFRAVHILDETNVFRVWQATSSPDPKRLPKQR